MEATAAPTDADVLIVGAGPAGGWLAGDLAAAGLSVILIDRLQDLQANAFSSAALPQASVERFGIPEAVIAARFSGWQLHGPGAGARHWPSGQCLGAVLDFGALRSWLAQRALDHGARLVLGWKAIAWQELDDGVQLTLSNSRAERREIRGRWLVDATGSQRQLIGPCQHPLPEPLVSGIGVEWLLSVSQPQWQAWSDRLSFMLGSDWVPQGYGWIFPMQAPLLKVGVCRLEDHAEAGRAPSPPLGALLHQLLKRQGLSEATVLDRHGGRIESTVGRRECHRLGRLIGLGDAVSTANLLGGEGIRHALLSAQLLAPRLLTAVLRHQGLNPSWSQRLLRSDPLRSYPGALRRALGWRWQLSGRLARRTWLGLRDPRADRRLERLLQGLERQPAEVLSSLLFDYRFERYGLRALPDLLGLRRGTR